MENKSATTFYVLLSSFQTSADALQLAERVAARLAQRGYTLRTDALTNLTRAAAQGALRANGEVELYLPSPQHATALDDSLRHHPNVRIHIASPNVSINPFTNSQLQTHLVQIVERNRALLNGRESTPAAFALVWSTDGVERRTEVEKRNDPQALFIKQAEENRTPVFNLARKDALQRIAQLLTQIERTDERNRIEGISYIDSRVDSRACDATQQTRYNMTKKKKEVFLYADACVLNNQFANLRQAACAALLIIDGKAVDATIKRFDEPLTNQQAEISAAIEAFRLAKKHRIDAITLRTDSLYVVETLKGTFRQKANREFWEELRHTAHGVDFSVEHVRGHNGDRWNELADVLARLAAQGRFDEVERCKHKVLTAQRNAPNDPSAREKIETIENKNVEITYNRNVAQKIR